MKNWDTLEADVDIIMGIHFTPGRTATIDKVVLHHNAGRLTVQQCYDTWQTREASAHYQVQYDGVIGQLVHDRDTAWHAGPANPSSIGIEHADDKLDPDWTISADTLENGAHLVAALCKHYSLGRPTWQTNVFGHRDFMSTACPGAIYAAQRDAYMDRAGQWYDTMTAASGAAPPASPASAAPSSAKPYQGMAVPDVIKAGSGQYFGLITGPAASHGGGERGGPPAGEDPAAAADRLRLRARHHRHQRRLGGREVRPGHRRRGHGVPARQHAGRCEPRPVRSRRLEHVVQPIAGQHIAGYCTLQIDSRSSR